VLTRYKKDDNGKLIKQANVYTQTEHNLNKASFDSDAVEICKILQTAGYESYIVGGAIRDLLCDITPKDFDIVTSAHPQQVKKLFKYARIIGKRFKLVHVVINGKIFEVATFRAGGHERNVYGSFDEDVTRRDFTLNALYYDPVAEKLIDFHSAMRDIKKRLIEPILPLESIFREDPVRMLRAVKYSVITGSKISSKLRDLIKEQAMLLKNCSHSRLGEELLKILANNHAAEILNELYNYDLLKYFLPTIDSYLTRLGKARHSFFKELALKEDKSRAYMVFCLLKDYIKQTTELKEDNFNEVVQTVRLALRPIALPHTDIADATSLLYAEAGISLKVKEPDVHIRKKPKRLRPARKKKEVIRKKNILAP